MSTIKQFKETIDLCSGAQHNKDVYGWNTLHEYDKSSPHKEFSAKVYKQGNRIVITFAGTNMISLYDLRNDKAIWNNIEYQHIPSQYGEAERLYNQVKSTYPNADIEFAGYSLGGSIANLMSHRTGLTSHAIAPIGSEHIAKAYPQYFPYGGENITTYGRKGDSLFYNNISRQSGNIVILPNFSKGERGIHLPFENHLLHNFHPYQFTQATLYKKKSIPKIPYYSNISNSRIENPMRLQNAQLTGYAAPLENLVQKTKSDFAGYANPLTGNNRIFTREEVGAMTKDEFARNEKEIMAQVKAMGGNMPTNGDLAREAMTGGGVVYVHPYTRSDGTPVKGYYRSR